MSIHMYNSMTGEKEALQTLEPGKVRFYACGPTVYNLFHIGNARMFIVFDTVRRYLEYRGYEVKYVQNFTDVDDRIIARSKELNIGVRDVANMYIDEYFKDADALNIRRATVHPRVTECIPEIIAFVQALIDKGHAYVSEGDVYFDTSSFATYGKLSHQSPEDMRAGFRVDVLDQKHDPTDFALWKSAKPGEEYWESPFGPGRPGWHIECSVMNHQHFGDQIDIHAGGRDLIFPHHENEIAQTEAHTGKTFAKYWLHNGTLNINGEKMSKSTGNFVMTRDLLTRREARVIRFFLLSAQYRHPLNYTEQALDQSEQGLERIDTAIRNLEHHIASMQAAPEFLGTTGTEISEATHQDLAAIEAQFIEAMDDDFNTANGITAIFEGVRRANSALAITHMQTINLEGYHRLLIKLLDVLGIPALEAQEMPEAEIAALIEARLEARRERDFAKADEIRNTLLKKGVQLEDTPQGTRWSYKE